MPRMLDEELSRKMVCPYLQDKCHTRTCMAWRFEDKPIPEGEKDPKFRGYCIIMEK